MQPWRIYQVLAVLSGFGLQCSCLPFDHGSDRIFVRTDTGTFKEPAVNFRPRFRYWIPDASVDLERVAQDIADAGAIGAAGVELLGYYLYGASPGTFVPVDWATYGWGTPAWKKLFDTAIKAHYDNGLIMDFAMGPNQGQGVPADEDDEGLLWDLDPFFVYVPLGGSFHDTIPGWGTGQLQAVVTGLITKSVNVSTVAPSLPNDEAASRLQQTLSAQSLTDVTDKVSHDGHLEINFPDGQDGLENIVFATYLVRSGEHNQEPPGQLEGPQTQPQNFIQNGSWSVDHFSAQGANVMTNFWEKYILIDGTKEMLMKVGEYAWEDSIEINPNIYWTPVLPQAFEERRGYSINKYYPILFHQNSLQEHFTTWFITDEPDAGNSHIADYRTTLTEQYGEYLDALTSWAHDYLDIRFSSQVGYNMAVDMQSDIPKVDTPECENLAFAGSIDGYRQYAGPANMAGKRIISTEAGAAIGQAYQQTVPDLLQIFKQSLTGTVNAFVIHGYPFSGQYPNTTWPGFTTFTYAFSDMHGRHQPSWDFQSAQLGYCTRHSYLFQTGIPKMDVAFYQKLTTYPETPTNYVPSDLLDVGYAYQYLNPENLALPEAYVQNGVLGPKTQSYKALIVRGNDTMTVLGAKEIARIAHDGLPIIFSGGIPTYLASYDPKGAEYVKETLESIRGLKNVHEAPYEGLADVVASLGIEPLTKVKANSTWWTVWLENDEQAADYIFVYNSAISFGTDFSEGTIEFQSTGQPYFFDTWSGEETPILNYTQTKTTTTIFFQLAPDQTIVVGFKNKEIPLRHAVSTSGNIVDIVQSDGQSLEAHVGYNEGKNSGYVKTADGKLYTVRGTSAQAFEVVDWTLTVEHWDPPSPLTNASVVADKHNTTHQLTQLTSWQNIDGLQHVSGRGYYESSFDWPLTDDTSGAIISFGPIVQTLSVSINKHQLPPLDLAAAKADITQYLIKGKNTVEAIVSTTLANVLAPIWNELIVSGSPPEGLFGSPTQPSGTADYGLLYPVVVTPYNTVNLN